jgi:hypothetical protein
MSFYKKINSKSSIDDIMKSFGFENYKIISDNFIETDNHLINFCNLNKKFIINVICTLKKSYKEDNPFGPSSFYFSSCKCNIKKCVKNYGKLVNVFYKKNGLFHRTNGPAYLCYDNGLIVNEKFFINGKKHNPVGPACRVYYNNRWVNEFYIKGNIMNKDVFFKNIKIKGIYE